MPPLWANSWKKNTIRYNLDNPRKVEWLTIDFFKAFYKKWICTHISLVEIKIIILPNMFLDHFIWGGDTPLVLREWWDAVNQYLRRGERVRGRLLLLKEWWEVVIEVNATDWWSIYWIIQLFFRLTILLPKLKFLSWAVTLGWAFVMRMRNSHRNTGLQLLLKIWPIRVFDPFPSVWTVYH